MDEVTLQQELRAVKRRRIEIRGTKAALDLEDFNLDDQQSTIEQLLHAREHAAATPAGAVRKQSDERIEILRSQSRQDSVTVQPPRRDPVAIVTEAKTEIETKTKTEIKNEVPQKSASNEIVTIDIDKDDDDDGSDVIILGQRRKRPSPQLQPINETKESFIDHNHKAEHKKTRPSKIVKLKVRFDPNRDITRYTGQLHQDDMSSGMVHESRRHQVGFSPRLQSQLQQQPRLASKTLRQIQSAIPPNSHLQTSNQRNPRITTSTSTATNRAQSQDKTNTSSPTQTTTTSWSPTHTTTTTPTTSTPTPTSSLTHNHNHNHNHNHHPARPLEPPTSQQTCPCLGRNRNCRLCRGTPAVIAEGQWQYLLSPVPPHPNPHLNSAHHNDRLAEEPRPTGQRPIARPRTYRIAAFEEMDDAERRELEVRFCRRVVGELRRLVGDHDYDHEDNHNHNHDHDQDHDHPHTHNQDPEPRTSMGVKSTESSWIHDLKSQPDIRDMILSELKDALRRRAVAREDEDGVWDGRVFVCRCPDAEEFGVFVGELLGRVVAGCGTGTGHGHGHRYGESGGCGCVVGQGQGRGQERGGSGNGSGIGDGRERGCWVDGLRKWFDARMEECAACIEACASEVNVGERRRVVDAWEVG